MLKFNIGKVPHHSFLIHLLFAIIQINAVPVDFSYWG